MPRADADRNLLFGMLALQNGLIDPADLVAGFQVWSRSKDRSLADILVERGALDPTDRDALGPMVARHVARHGNDPAASLAALSSIATAASDLRRAVADPDVLASLAHIPRDPHAPRAHEATPSTSGEIALVATLIPDPSAPAPPGVRYRKVRHHAIGGLGVVFVARDEELNREVALKEIQDEQADDPASRARFLIEAEVTGGLEHPGIVPVYGLGSYEDGRPFYAMRFIKGDSLKDAIARFHADDALKSDPGARALALQKLLWRFLDVCNAIDYAHSRGVLHRDLKPDNVMVGRYGETLVVNWGLAKTAGRSGGGDGTDLPEATLSPASASGSNETSPGSVIGTPAYMSPEQAAGRLDLLGPASDVYSLGATLYTLLTGRVPFADKALKEVLRKVERGEFARPREASPWLDPALEAICLKAMATRPEARYPSARALADEVNRWVAGEPVAAYPEPFARRARRWARKHRTAVTTAAATATVAALLLGGAGWIIRRQTQKTDAAALESLAKADRLEIEARATSALAKWSEAVAEAQRADARLESGGGSAGLRLRTRARLAALEAEEARRRDEIQAEERDRRMVADLEEARLLGTNVKDDHFDVEAIHEAYLAAFRAYGIDVATLPPEEAADRVRSSRIGEELIAALDHWALGGPRHVPAGRLDAIAKAADTDPSRPAIGDAIARKDSVALRRLMESGGEMQGLQSRSRRIFDALLALDPTANLPLLEAIQREYPSDFWFNDALAFAYHQANPPRSAESVGYLRGALALRPRSPGVHFNLGVALAEEGNHAAAIAAFHQAIRIKPDYAEAHKSLGTHLAAKGDHDGAVAALREAVRIKPDYAEAYSNLGFALAAKGDPDGAIAALREAVRIKSDLDGARINLGAALDSKGDHDGAIATYREAIRINPESALAHYNLGLALQAKGDPDGAIAEHLQAIRINPEYAEAHCNMGLIQQRQGRLTDALSSLERGHELGSSRGNWRNPSALWVRDCRRLVELDGRLPALLKGEVTPKDDDERLVLAGLCYNKGFQAASARFYGEVITEQPGLAGDLATGHRYNAACAAALAGSGKGKDDPPLEEAARIGWREKAREWLWGDLAAWAKSLDGGPPQARQNLVRTLEHWKVDADLAGIRDNEALARLPEAEREAFRSLWADVEALRLKAAGGK